MKLKYFIKGFDFLRAYNSPFKPLKLKWYFGKTAIGTPYFLPRKWIKRTHEDNVTSALNAVSNPKLVVKTFEEWYKSYKGSLKAVKKTVGFDFVPLGWKTKYDEYRFEWSPMWSFVFFGYQIAVTFVAPEEYHYWECWLVYTRETDKTKTTAERIEQAKKVFPCNWKTYRNGIEEKICYWDVILKDKFNNK